MMGMTRDEVIEALEKEGQLEGHKLAGITSGEQAAKILKDVGSWSDVVRNFKDADMTEFSIGFNTRSMIAGYQKFQRKIIGDMIKDALKSRREKERDDVISDLMDALKKKRDDDLGDVGI